PRDLYFVRDDGVITLSHARNLIDYGFIGVNPSGECVEGFSSPLHFAIFAVVYAITGSGYVMFSSIFPFVCDFLLGVVLFLVARELLKSRSLPSAVAMILAVIGAAFVVRAMSVTLWLHSGMENPLTQLAYGACILVYIRAL